MTGKMSLSAILYFAANPSHSNDDVLARLTRKIRNNRSGAQDGVRSSTDTLSRKIAEKRDR